MFDLARIEKVEQDVYACNKCPEPAAARLYPMPGFFGSDVKLMIIGINPGPWDNAEKERLKTFNNNYREAYEYGIKHCPVGDFLNRALEAMEITWDDIFFTNLIKCATPNVREPSDLEVSNCSKYLQEQIAVVQPKNLLFLSEFVANKLGIDVKPMTYEIIEETTVIVLYHPSYLRRRGKIDEATNFLKAVPLLAK